MSTQQPSPDGSAELTVAFTDSRRRTMVAAVAWRELQRLVHESELEALVTGLWWPDLQRGDHAACVAAAAPLAARVGEWGRVLAATQDPDARSVELPLDDDELRERVAEHLEYVRVELADADDLRGRLDYADHVAAFAGGEA